MPLMQSALVFAPILQVQHARLVAAPSNYDKLPLGYASHQVGAGRLEQVIEALERG
jgi:hypothetical protein